MREPSFRQILRTAAVTISLAVGVTLLATLYAGGSTPQQRDFSAQPFKGVTTDGSVMPGLFAVRASGVSTAPDRKSVV